MDKFPAEKIVEASRQKFGKCLCVECGKKAKVAAENAVKADGVVSAVNAGTDSDLAAQLMAAAEE